MSKRNSEGIRELTFSPSYKSAGRDWQPPADLDDMGQVIQMGLGSIREHGMGVVAYPETEEGLQQLKDRSMEYFERIIEINAAADDNRKLVIPDFEGLALFLGISRVTLYKYAKRNDPQWGETIALFKTLITAARKQITTTFRVPPMWEIFNLINNDVGYLNTNAISVTTNRDDCSSAPALSQEEIQSIIGSQMDEPTSDNLLAELPD